MDEEEEHSSREVSIILNIWKLLMQKMKMASPKARRPKTILSTNRKVQTQTRRLLLIWTLFSATSKLMVWKMRRMKAYLRPSLTTFCRNLFECTEAKRRRIRAVDSFQFSALYKLTAILRRNTHLRSQRTMSSINQKSPFSEAKVTCSDMSTAKETNCKLLRTSTKTKRMPFFFKFWIRRPQSSCASKNCVVVFIQHLGLRAREYQSSDPLLSSTAPVFTGAN